MRKQYIVQESNKNKREKFYDYLKKIYGLNTDYPYTKKYFIESKFPFVIDFKNNNFWICNSITCCALASSNKLIISIEEFKTINNI